LSFQAARIYADGCEASGVGINAMVGSISSALGPTVASAILAVAHWPWLFAVNVPTGALAFICGLRSLPSTPLAGHRFDPASAALSAITFGLLITGIDGLGHGQGTASILAQIGGAVVVGGVLVSRQMSEPAPLLPVDLLRIPLFALSVATSICAFAAQGLAYVSLPFFFQDVLGRSQVATGLLMTGWPLTVAVFAPWAGRLADRVSAGLLGGLGLTALALGLALLATMPAHPSDIDVIWRMSICGLGFAFFNSPNNRAMITSAPPHRTGGASGMLATGRLLGQTTGAALVAMAFGFFPARGTTVTLVMASCFAGAAAVASLMRLGGKARGGGAG